MMEWAKESLEKVEGSRFLVVISISYRYLYSSPTLE
jgi:hypothetical protein